MTSTIATNPRGIPTAPFFDNVHDAIISGSAQTTLAKFDEMIKKYKFMESQLTNRHVNLTSKIPEIKASLQSVDLLLDYQHRGQPLITDFELNDTLYAKATIPSAHHVSIWLGANVMIEYPIQEAHALLSSKLDKATVSLEQVNQDLEFIREQVTTMEVNLARVYNWDVKNRKQQQQPSPAPAPTAAVGGGSVSSSSGGDN